MVFNYNSYVKVVILGNLCGGPFQDAPRRVYREISPSRPSLSEYPRFLRELRTVYLNIFVFLEKNAKFICVPLVSPEKSGPVYLRTLVFPEKLLTWLAWLA